MAAVNDPRPLGLQNPVVYREVALVGSADIADVTAGPTMSVGTGVPTHTRPNGSLYLRKDGAATTALYSRVSGAWVAPDSDGPIVVETTIGFADLAALGAVANGQVDVAVLPAGAYVLAAYERTRTDFSGGAVSAMTVSLGLDAGDVDRYTRPESCFTGVGAANLTAAGVAFDGTNSAAPDGGSTVAANFVATGDTMDNVAAGSLICRVVYTVPNA